jgi:hypothetical protein
MTTTLTPNGKPRKQLSDQLDRMDEQLARQDAVIDALADGLNQAVGDAAKVGVKEAVQAAVVELLTSIELRAALHQATAPPAAARPTAWDRLKAFGRKVVEKGRAVTAAIRRAVTGKAIVLKAAAAVAAGPLSAVWKLRRAVAVGLGVGAAVTAVAVVAGHPIASALSGLAATVAALAVQATAWVRAKVRRFAAT